MLKSSLPLNKHLKLREAACQLCAAQLCMTSSCKDGLMASAFICICMILDLALNICLEPAAASGMLTGSFPGKGKSTPIQRHRQATLQALWCLPAAFRQQQPNGMLNKYLPDEGKSSVPYRVPYHYLCPDGLCPAELT